MIIYKDTNPEAPRDFIMEENINTEFIGRTIYYFDTTDSTNNEAKKHSDCPEGTVFAAKVQTAGRGRKGRNWASDSNGLWFSILLKPDISPEEVSQITLVLGIAVTNVIKNSYIKWPNDIVMGNKKLAGILTEMSTTENKVNYVVAGIGININTPVFSDEISDIATSLYIENGIEYSKEKILADLCSEIEFWYKKFRKSGFSECREEYISRCITLNREVCIKNGNDSYIGRAVDVNNNGELTVKTDKGDTDVLSGEVSVRGLFGYI